VEVARAALAGPLGLPGRQGASMALLHGLGCPRFWRHPRSVPAYRRHCSPQWCRACLGPGALWDGLRHAGSRLIVRAALSSGPPEPARAALASPPYSRNSVDTSPSSNSFPGASDNLHTTSAPYQSALNPFARVAPGGV